MAKVTNILAGDGFRGDLSSIVSTTTAEEKKQLRDQFFKDLADNAVAVPVGVAEGALGLPGDLEGLVRGGYRAFNAEDGERLDAFSSAFGDTFIPSTQQIQEFTNENLFDNEIGEMIKRGKYGRLAGEFVAPATIITAPSKTLAKGASVLADTSFFKNLANPLGLDTALSIVNKAEDVGPLLNKADDIYDPLKRIDPNAIKYYDDPRAFFGKPEEWAPYIDNVDEFKPTYGTPITKPEVTINTNPATNSFFDNIRLTEDDMMKYADDIEFKHNNPAYTKGGEISIIKGEAPYQTTKKVLENSDNPYKGAVQNKIFTDNTRFAEKYDPSLGHADPYEYWKGGRITDSARQSELDDLLPMYSETLSYQPNIRTGAKAEGTFIRDLRKRRGKKPKGYWETDGLTENKIRNMQNIEPRSLTSDKAWVTGTTDNTGKSTIGDFYQELYNTKAGNYPESIRRNYMFDEVNKIKSPDNMFDQIENAGYFPTTPGRGKVDIDYVLNSTPEELKQAYSHGRLSDDYINDMKWSSFEDGKWLDETRGQKVFKPSDLNVGDVEPLTLDSQSLNRMSKPLRNKLETAIKDVDTILTETLDSINAEPISKSTKEVKRYIEQVYKKLLNKGKKDDLWAIRPEQFKGRELNRQGLLDIDGSLTVDDGLTTSDVDDMGEFIRDLIDGRGLDSDIR
jgi:hypothetical protein